MDEIGDFAPSETGGFITVSYALAVLFFVRTPLSDLVEGILSTVAVLTIQIGPSDPTQEVWPG